MKHPLNVAFLGNFSVGYSTETHVALSLESLGHRVTRIQEGQVPALEVPTLVQGHDVFLHTQTFGLAVQSGSVEERRGASEQIRQMGIPRVYFHLDRYIGLAREDQLSIEPWTEYDYVFTADGGHDDEFKALGINHFWSSPGVYHAECYDAEPQDRFRSDVAFVGSWDGYGHHEWWPYRSDLLEHLRNWYGDRFKCWPERGRPAVRGDALNALYASTKVVIGDSCLAGNARAYVSDRVPETAGRGGFIIHPFVEDVLPGVFWGVPGWEVGDWDRLHELIEVYLADDCLRDTMRTIQARDVRSHHTYRMRLLRVLDVVFADSEASEERLGHSGAGPTMTPCIAEAAESVTPQ